MNLWQCPHPSLFLKEICNTLDTCQSHCIVNVPGRLIPSFQEELLSYWRGTREELPLLALDDDTKLLDAISPSFLTDSKTTSLSALKECPLRGSRTLAVILPERRLSNEQEFFDFLNKDLVPHAKNCRDNSLDLYWNMLVIAPADRPIPTADIGLKCFYWWGHLHNSDLEYAIECAFQDIFRNGSKQEKLAYWWLYPLCKGVALGDPELVESIYRDFPKDMKTLIASLKKHELNTEENGRLVKKFLEGTRSTLKPDDHPRGVAATLWHKGILDIDSNGRIAIHPAALVAADYIKRLEELVIRGQMLFFLPLVQEIHNMLSRQVEKHLGSALEEWIPDDGSLDSARYEIGPFSAFLSFLYKEKGKPIPYDIVDTAKKWRDLRNDMAHINMLSYQKVEDAFNSYEKLLKMN